MIIDKSIKATTVVNTDIQRIMHGGGYFVGKRKTF